MNKQFFKLALLLFIGFAVVSFSSCKKDENANAQPNAIIGNWTVNKTTVSLTVGGMDLIAYLTTNFGVTTEEAQAFEDMLKEDYPDTDTDTETVEFKADNSYHIASIDMTDEEDGTWSVSGDGKTLSLVDSDQDQTNLEIVSLTASALVLTTQLDESEEFDFDEDGVNESTIDIGLELNLSK
jgi:hypothetical protein